MTQATEPLVKARHRAKTHLRRANGRYTDITPAYERMLRRKAKRCPLCHVRLIDTPYLPTSKELDHIIPLNRMCGGTHTIGNVRIICRACNLARPKDGSDYTGPVTLWAQVPGFIPRRPPDTARWRCPHGVPSSRRCRTCQPPATPPRQHDGQRAAELRAQGWAWGAIATELGFCTGSNAGAAARRYGDPEVKARWPADDPRCVKCGAGLPRGGVGRPRRICSGCTW